MRERVIPCTMPSNEATNSTSSEPLIRPHQLCRASLPKHSRVGRCTVRVQFWVPNVVKKWLRLVGNVVSSCGCKVFKQKSPTQCFQTCGHATWSEKLRIECKQNVTTANNVGQFLNKKRNMSLIFGTFLPSKNGRRSVTSFPTLFFACKTNRHSAITLLPHVVTSL